MKISPVDEGNLFFHDDVDNAFGPMVKHTNNDRNVLGQYMYMYHDNSDTYHYKHKMTRSYVSLDMSGTIVKGEIEEWSDNEW